MKFSREEQETTLVFEAATGEWNFYSCVPAHIQLFMSNPSVDNEKIEVLTEHEGKPTSIRFKVDKSHVTQNFFKHKVSAKKLAALQKARAARQEKRTEKRTRHE